MIRYSCVLSDLGRIYPDIEFSKSNIIIERLDLFFKNKFDLFFKNTKIVDSSDFSKIVTFLNDNVFIPLRDYYIDSKDINGLKANFIEQYKEDILNCIPAECKKIKKEIDIKSISNSKLLEMRFYSFYKNLVFLASQNRSYEFNFILEDLNFELNSFPTRLHYLFDNSFKQEYQYVPIDKKPLGYMSHQEACLCFRKDIFYYMLIQNKNPSINRFIGKHFLKNYFSIKILSRDNFYTRELTKFKDEIFKEIKERNLHFYDFIDTTYINYLKGLTRRHLEEKEIDDILDLLNILWNDARL